jgi:enoyl-CoA hydratase/carnithine racemase
MTAMERMDVLFVAAINGHCLGGGRLVRAELG